MNRQSHPGTLSHPFSIKTFSKCRSRNSLDNGCLYMFLFSGTSGSWVSFTLGCMPILHHLLVLRILGVWRSHPELLRLSCATQKIPARWTHHTSLSRLLQRLRVVQHGLCMLFLQLVVQFKVFRGGINPWASFALFLCPLNNLLFAVDLIFAMLASSSISFTLGQLRPSHPESSLLGS